MKRACAASLMLLCLADAAFAADGDKAKADINTKANDKPRRIYGHYMGCFVAGTGAIYSHSHSGLGTMDCPRSIRDANPMQRNLAAWAKTSPGGTYRNFDLSPYDRRLTLEEAADLEIRRAMRIGLDGFTFDAWAGGDGAKKLFATMMKVCREKKYPFELTITLDASCLKKDKGGVRGAYVREIKWLLDNYGDSPHLARRGGKPLIMGYQSAWPWVQHLYDVCHAKGLTGDAVKKEVSRLRTCEEGWKLIGPAFRKLEEQIGRPIYWEFCLSAFLHNVGARAPKDCLPRVAAILARELPAVGSFDHLGDRHEEVAKAVIEAGAEWSQPMWLQYENYGYYQAASPGTEWIRGNWAAARRQPSTLMQYITWNDYHENTNLTPGINTRYAYYDLTGYFIEWWKTGKQPKVDHDKVYLFSHRVPKGEKIYPFKGKADKDSVIEVLTILPRPATMRVPGRKLTSGGPAEWQAPAGLSFRHLALTPGPVSAELVRDGKVEVRLDLPEPVGVLPFRPDIGKNAISTEFARHWKADFGDVKPYVYTEYADNDGDGLPNWFEMLWFGKFGDMSTATVAKPDDDPDEDGRPNIQEYREQTDPTTPQTPPATPQTPQ